MRVLLTNPRAASMTDLLRLHAGEYQCAVGPLAVALLDQGLADHARVVVPHVRTARSVSDCMMRAVCAHTQKPSPSFHTDTMQTFVRHLHTLLATSGRQPVTTALRHLLLRSAITEAKGLTYFRTETREPTAAVVESIAESVQDLILRGYSLAMLERLRTSNRLPRNRTSLVSDIACVLDAYERSLGDHRIDLPGIYEAVSKGMGSWPSDSERSIVHPLPSCVIFDLFSRFSEPEEMIIRGVCSSDIPTAVFVTVDATNPELFGRTFTTIDTLVTMGFTRTDCQAAVKDDESSPVLHPVPHLDASLFARTAAVAPMRTSPATVQILTARDRTDEISSIARFVKHCIRTNGVPAERIAVVSGHPRTYLHLFEQEFADSGIPVHSSGSHSLATSPVVNAFFVAMDCAERQYLRADVERVLANPWLDVHPNNDRLDVKGLHHAARELRLTGGAANGGINGWIDTLRSAEKRAKAMEELSADSDESPTSTAPTSAMYTKSIRDLEHLRDMLPEPDHVLSPERFRQTCGAYWSSLGIKKRIDDSVQAHVADVIANGSTTSTTVSPERIAREAMSFMALVDELVEAETACSINRLPLRTHLSHLRALVHETSVRSSERTGSGVFLGGLTSIVGIPFDVVVVAGMVEGMIPAPAPASVLADLSAEYEQEHEAAERLIFHAVLAGIVERRQARILLCHPAKNESGEDCLPSLYLDAVHRSLAPEVIDAEKERAAARTSRENISGGDGDTTADHASDHASDQTSSSILHPWLFTTVSRREVMQSATLRQAAGQDLQDLLRAEHRSTEHALMSIDQVVSEYAEQRRNTAPLILTNDTSASEAQTIDAATPRTYSITELESYAACPFRYHASRHLRLNELPADDIDVTASERGNILHRIAYEFYKHLLAELPSDADTPCGVRLDASRRLDYLVLLREIGTKVLHSLAFDHPYYEVLQNDLQGTGGTDPGVLETWLDGELTRYQKTYFEPFMVEVEFGRQSDGRGEEFTIGDISFRGRIDRIDIRRLADGTVDFLVVDYKSSDGKSIKSNSDILTKGGSFQVPVYIEAARTILQTAFPTITFTPRGGLYVAFMMKDAKNLTSGRSWSYVLLENAEPKVDEELNAKNSSQVLTSRFAVTSTEKAIAVSMEKVKVVLEKMTSGLFPVLPADAATCTYCPFGSVCGIEDIRRSNHAGGLPEEIDASETEE